MSTKKKKAEPRANGIQPVKRPEKSTSKRKVAKRTPPGKPTTVVDRVIMRVEAPISVEYFSAIVKAMQRVAGKKNTVFMRDIGGRFEFFTREVRQ